MYQENPYLNDCIKNRNNDSGGYIDTIIDKYFDSVVVGIVGKSKLLDFPTFQTARQINTSSIILQHIYLRNWLLYKKRRTQPSL